MTAYPGQTWMTLGQLCATLWDSQSQPDVIQPGFETGTVVTPLALRYSAQDRYATRKPRRTVASILKQTKFELATQTNWAIGEEGHWSGRWPSTWWSPWQSSRVPLWIWENFLGQPSLQHPPKPLFSKRHMTAHWVWQKAPKGLWPWETKFYGLMKPSLKAKVTSGGNLVPSLWYPLYIASPLILLLLFNDLLLLFLIHFLLHIYVCNNCIYTPVVFGACDKIWFI
jgi:hypothetical protein